MAGTSPAMTRERWFDTSGIRSKLARVAAAALSVPAPRRSPDRPINGSPRFGGFLGSRRFASGECAEATVARLSMKPIHSFTVIQSTGARADLRDNNIRCERSHRLARRAEL
jgi:hypothetical protein